MMSSRSETLLFKNAKQMVITIKRKPPNDFAALPVFICMFDLFELFTVSATYKTSRPENNCIKRITHKIKLLPKDEIATVLTM